MRHFVQLEVPGVLIPSPALITAVRAIYMRVREHLVTFGTGKRLGVLVHSQVDHKAVGSGIALAFADFTIKQLPLEIQEISVCSFYVFT